MGEGCMAIRVGEGTVVTLSYRLQTENGDVLEDRTPENPFEFQFGCGETLPAIESIIRGKTEGFEASLGVAAAEAYGDYRDDLLVRVPLDRFPEPKDVQVGMKFGTVGPDGEPLTVRVIEVDEEECVVDGNHPLAGLAIEIDLKILKIEAAEGSDEIDSSADESGEHEDIVVPKVRRVLH